MVCHEKTILLIEHCALETYSVLTRLPPPHRAPGSVVRDFMGLIGVAAALLIFNVPFGFVAMLGTIALAGMIMRNSLILVDPIDTDIREGSEPAIAIVEATVRRFRPIMLTAAAAVLAMIPLTRSAFYGPMAVAIMGGLVVATALTLLFLPALYAAWFRVAAPTRA